MLTNYDWEKYPEYYESMINNGITEFEEEEEEWEEEEEEEDTQKLRDFYDDMRTQELIEMRHGFNF